AGDCRSTVVARNPPTHLDAARAGAAAERCWRGGRRGEHHAVARSAEGAHAGGVLGADAVAVVVLGGAARVRVRGGGEVVRGGGPCGPGAAAVAAVLVLQVVGDARAVAVGGGPGDGSGAVTAYRCGRGGWGVRAA